MIWIYGLGLCQRALVQAPVRPDRSQGCPRGGLPADLLCPNRRHLRSLLPRVPTERRHRRPERTGLRRRLPPARRQLGNRAV